MDDLLREFLTETSENLSVLDRDLVRLEQTPDDPKLLQGIFRLVHTVKGTCGFLGLKRLERLTHAAESVLGKIRDGALRASPETVGAVLDALDRIKSLLAGLEAEGREVEGDDRDLIERLGRAGAAHPTAQPPAPAPKAAFAVSEPANALPAIRVNLDVIESLMAMVSELVLTRNQLMQILRGRDDSEFAAPLQRLSQVTSELQDGVMKTRMQPIGAVWAKLPRIVRDLARDLGKKIELKLDGAETELDRQVLELIRDPLIHMVRNAADHGIETPQERRRQGKPDAGTISLSARHESGAVIVELEDDGNGIDVERIREHALQSGFATPAELAGMTDPQLQQLIFRPGLLTAAQVTRVSGRGVGMDVVRANIEKIGGAIELRSSRGRGSRFVIKVPLTLAIFPGLILDCGGQRFAMPQTAVAELVRVGGRSGHELEWLHDGALLRLRGRLLPVVALQSLLRLGKRAPVAPVEQRPVSQARAPGCVAVIKVGIHRFGLLVDGVNDAEEIVVKPVPTALRGIALYAGNTILGDGSVVMILDPKGVAAAIGGSDRDETAPADAQPARLEPVERGASLLLFRAGAGGPKAVTLGPIAELDEIAIDAVEYAGGVPMVRYRGQRMKLIVFEPGARLSGRGKRPVMVFAGRAGFVGLVADEILDVVADPLAIDPATARPGVIGTAIIAGRATEIVDAAHYVANLACAERGARGAA